MVKQPIKVIYNDLVKNVRPFILCCIVKGINLRGEGRLRIFFQIQTKIHNGDVGGKRERSTIGTHDLSKLAPGGFIHYTTQSPDNLIFAPLGRSLETASQLIRNLKAEAEIIRTADKRKVRSGIYQYIYLVENKEQLACLEDATGNVICLPPLINSESTKVVAATTDIFVEITSSSTMADCFRTMEEFMKEMLLAGFGGKCNEGDSFDQLRLEPVRIVDSDGYLKIVYPSRTETMLDVNR